VPQDLASERKRWADAYRKGKSMQQIADDNDVSPSTVHAALKALGVPANDHRKGPLYHEMYERGHSLSVVARHFKVSRQAVHQALVRLGVELRGRGNRSIEGRSEGAAPRDGGDAQA
jgi:predicted DNA-binding protein YlxM (UPF0122 family)